MLLARGLASIHRQTLPFIITGVFLRLNVSTRITFLLSQEHEHVAAHLTAMQEITTDISSHFFLPESPT